MSDAEIQALATRIERAMRESIGRRLKDEVITGEVVSDNLALAAILDDLHCENRERMTYPQANRLARITWLAGVLAGAMGRTGQPKGEAKAP